MDDLNKDDPKKKQSGEKDANSGRDAFDVHRQMVVFLFAATFVTVAILALLLWRRYESSGGSQVTALMVVALSGVLGGFVSALRRLYAFAPVFPSITFSFWSKRSTGYVLMYSAIPPLVGAIAAVVVYLIFAGEMLKGPLFPAFGFDARHTTDQTFENFLANWQPKETIDYAKAFVWAFVAGFSEKFVPDILNRFGQSSGKSDKDA